MNHKKTTKSVFFTAFAGLVILHGLVYARALESDVSKDVFLSPTLTQFSSYEEVEQALIASTSGETTTSSLEKEDAFSQPTTSLPFTTLLYKLGFTSNPLLTSMISDIAIKKNSSSSVTLSWNLTSFADVTIYYSKDQVDITNSQSKVKVSAFRFSNEATIEGLESNSTYNYILVVDNHFGGEEKMVQGTFRTAP